MHIEQTSDLEYFASEEIKYLAILDVLEMNYRLTRTGPRLDDWSYDYISHPHRLRND